MLGTGEEGHLRGQLGKANQFLLERERERKRESNKEEGEVWFRESRAHRSRVGGVGWS